MEKERHVMSYVSGGRTIMLDLCCFCKELKNLKQSGDCSFYEGGFDGDTCVGFRPVDNIPERLSRLMECRTQRSG